MVGSSDDNLKLDVLLSSYGDRLFDFTLKMPAVNSSVRYLVGHQGPKSEYSRRNVDSLLKKRDDIIYFDLETVGVTKSRNFLIEKSTADVIYFCDDDVELESDFAENIISSHNVDVSSIITFVVNNQTGGVRGKFLRMKKSIHLRGWFSILSVGTIEITVKRNTIDNIRFPADMGAGTKNPIGDEAVFLSSFLKNNKKISYHPLGICRHPEESSGCAASTQAMAYSRGLTLRRVFSYKSFIIAPFFFLRRKGLFKIDGSSWNGWREFCRGIIS